MKKLFCFFAFIFAISTMSCFFYSNQTVKADEISTFTLTNSNFSTELTDTNSNHYILAENITLESWTPINFGGTLDGNGFTISLKNNLFNVLNGATITNLGVILTEKYVYDTTELTIPSSNFGILAKEATSSTIENVFTKGDVEITVKASANVGGFLGKVYQGTIISNCYSNSSVVLTQTNDSLETIAGGFLGAMENSQITNCYAVPTLLKTAEIQTTLTTSSNIFAVGGFVGKAVKGSIGLISNIFCGGTVASPTANLSNLVVGKIFGQVNDFATDNLSYCYTYNTATQNFIGSKNNAYAETNFAVVEKGQFGDILNFAETYMLGGNYMWNFEYSWNTASTWCKKDTSSFPILQVFESFSIIIDSTASGLISTCGLSQWNGTNFIPTTESQLTFKYGTTLKITADINSDFAFYKIIKSIVKNNSTDSLNFVIAENKQSATYEFDVSNSTAGSYYATTENIEYTIKVQTESINKGKVKYGSSIAQELLTYTIVYGGEYTFVADPISSSFAFSTWSWLDGQGEEQTAIRGGTNSILTANRQINVCFGSSGTDTTKTYLNISSTSTIPYEIDEETGNITFTIQANFSENVCNLEISSLLPKDSYNLYINGTLWLNQFDESVQVGVPIEIRIEAKEGFTFNKWQAESGINFSRLIPTTESETSTTINLTISEDFVLYVDITENGSEATDLTWLWVLIGGGGGAGLVVLIIVLISKRAKRESFLNYY